MVGLTQIGVLEAVASVTAADLLDPPSAIGVSAALSAMAFIPLWSVWRSADARVR